VVIVWGVEELTTPLPHPVIACTVAASAAAMMIADTGDALRRDAELAAEADLVLNGTERSRAWNCIILLKEH
jgi:hypothetical protein